MGHTFFLASVMGPSFLLLGIALLINQKGLRNIAADWVKKAECLFLGGVVGVVVGLLLVNSHNVWEVSATGLVTLIGWLILIKGALYVLFPQAMSNVAKRMLTTAWMWVGTVLALVLGLYLTYVGFFI